MISEKGSSQPLLSITGTQAAWKQNQPRPQISSVNVNAHSLGIRLSNLFYVMILTNIFSSTDLYVNLWFSIKMFLKRWVAINIYT